MTTQAAPPLTLSTETVLRVLLFVMLAVGSISFVEPSPYEFVFLTLTPVVFFGHLVVTRVTIVLFFLVAGYLGGEMLALTPYFDDRPAPLDDGNGATAMVYTLQTTYLFVSALIFTVVFTRHTQARMRLALIAYAVSSVFAAAIAILAYLKVPGLPQNPIDTERAVGPFKDPNVLGAYCVLGVLVLMQSAMFGAKLMRPLILVVLGIVLFGGIFLPLSRGAWGAMGFAAIYFAVVTFWTAEDRAIRRKIVVGAVLLGLMGAGGAAYVASNKSLQSTVGDRAKLTQDYDNGYTGRFGNQKRAIPMLIERPLGFGPHRFTFYFDLDPHNSYIGAFSSGGWLGGIAYLLFVVTTSILALRLSIIASPYRRYAQVVAPALISAFLQAFQIDIDHWRFVYLMVGCVWGMEAARIAGLERTRAALRATFAGWPGGPAPEPRQATG